MSHLSACWLCRKEASCKHLRKEVVQKSWPSFPTSVKPIETLTKGISCHVHRSYWWFHRRLWFVCWFAFFPYFSLPSPWMNLCEPAKEDGLIKFQKRPSVKVKTLWKSSSVITISVSNVVTEVWFPIEWSFTADQLCLRKHKLSPRSD